MEQLDISNNKIIIIIIVLIICVFICIYFFTRNSMKEEYNEIENYEINENVTNDEQIDEEEKEEEIIVHVTGAVKKEGIVHLKVGARISDAIDAAGGVTDETNISQVNLAYELEDGQKIYIPSINDKKNDETEQILEKEYVTSEPGDEIALEEHTEESAKKEKGKININLADEIELQEIPGVGEATAKKIIEYREQNGKFKNIEDIKNVKGIGEGKYEEMKENICIK